MPSWTTTYHNELKAHFNALTGELPARMKQIAEAQTAPTLDALTIGSGRKLNAAVLFFDIENFTGMTPGDDDAYLQRTLWLLNCAVPMMMRVIHDYGGFIEKNTGDGVMALFAVEQGDEPDAVARALDAAATCFYVLTAFVNPYLHSIGLWAVNARIGIDFGPLLVAKIGVPTGSAGHQRNFLTAVGPTANIANRLQQRAGTNEIWVGDSVWRLASAHRRQYSFSAATPLDWPWTYKLSGKPYWVWRFSEVRTAPILFALRNLLGIK